MIEMDDEMFENENEKRQELVVDVLRGKKVVVVDEVVLVSLVDRGGGGCG